MKKIYFFSEKLNTEVLKNIPSIEGKLEIVKPMGLSAEEALKKDFDCIMLADGEYGQFKNYLGGVNWKTNHLEVADALILSDGGYRPVNLNADCILQLLRSKNLKIDTSQSAMIIGTYDFVLSVTAKIALSGFSSVVISVFEYERTSELVAKIKEFIFGMNIRTVRLSDLTLLQTASGLLVSNVTEEMDKEAYETLAYFNFLSHGAVFVDFHSYSNANLIEEARRAELFIIEELEILTLKMNSLL